MDKTVIDLKASVASERPQFRNPEADNIVGAEDSDNRRFMKVISVIVIEKGALGAGIKDMYAPPQTNV